MRVLNWVEWLGGIGLGAAAIGRVAKGMAGSEESDESDAGLSRWLGRAAKLARTCGPWGQRLLREVKTRSSFNQYCAFHDVLHSLRKIPHCPEEGALCPPGLAVEICTHFCAVMGHLLELKEDDLHCCMKVLLKDKQGLDRVGTIGRSEPYDHRPQEVDELESHLVEKNSVWCSLLGRDDGCTRWKTFLCFACNDLNAHPNEFQCDRLNWQDYYRSTLVFPLRYIRDQANVESVTVGFLAFDSPNAKVFGQIPDIFRHKNYWHTYHQKLRKTTAFHVGAVFADTLSVLLRNRVQAQQGSINEKG